MNSFPGSRRLVLIVVSVLALHGGVQAQDRRPEGGREGRGGREGMAPRMNPLFAALDTNGDGVIDAQEIANATASLRKLDRNGDGQLTEDEVRPAMGGRGGPGEGPRGPGGTNADEMVARLMQFDRDGDGRLSKEELPERMAGLMARGDTNHDGFLSREELTALARSMAAQGGDRERGREQH